VPLVALDDDLAPDGRRPSILNDNREVGRVAVRHLLERGLRSLAFYGPRGRWWSDERLAGAREAAPGGRIAVRRSGPQPWEAEQAGLGRWLAGLPGPAGLFAANDILGLRALDACRRSGLGVPEQVAVVGADDDAELCELSDPPLSSVAFHPERAGFEAASLLDRLMRGERAPRRPLLVAPRGVTTRQSTDVLAIADPHVARALHFIRRHACEGINAASVLREVGLSRRSLEHRFRKALGRTPKAEIRRLQIERAKGLLSGTELKIAAVADRCGFHQAAYLCAVFRRAVGTTPAAWRRQVLTK
jgi:LacI family transcriptional regulator